MQRSEQKDREELLTQKLNTANGTVKELTAQLDEQVRALAAARAPRTPSDPIAMAAPEKKTWLQERIEKRENPLDEEPRVSVPSYFYSPIWGGRNTAPTSRTIR
jgi:hypothetical protein